MVSFSLSIYLSLSLSINKNQRKRFLKNESDKLIFKKKNLMKINTWIERKIMRNVFKVKQ